MISDGIFREVHECCYLENFDEQEGAMEAWRSIKCKWIEYKEAENPTMKLEKGNDYISRNVQQACANEALEPFREVDQSSVIRYSATFLPIYVSCR